tara:strand:- start:409 stop:567 length:159 start_codon:yes stop_codon:yes gene_type:complete
MYYGHWDFQQAYSLPIGLRNWFIERLIKEKEKEKEASQGTQRPKESFGPPKF